MLNDLVQEPRERLQSHYDVIKIGVHFLFRCRSQRIQHFPRVLQEGRDKRNFNTCVVEHEVKVQGEIYMLGGVLKFGRKVGDRDFEKFKTKSIAPKQKRASFRVVLLRTVHVTNPMHNNHELLRNNDTQHNAALTSPS